MGRIKSGMTKKAAVQLYEKKLGLNNSFENNKKLLKGTIPYKSMRNKVAGGIAKLARKAQEKTNLKPIEN